MSYRANTIVKCPETLLCVLAIRVDLKKALLNLEGHIFVHNEVLIEPTCAVLQSFCHFVEPYNVWLVSAHHQVERQHDSRDTIIRRVEPTNEGVKLLDLILVFPLVDLAVLDLLCDILYKLLEDFRRVYKRVVEHRFESGLAHLGLLKGFKVERLLGREFALLLAVLLLHDYEQLVCKGSLQLPAEIASKLSDDFEEA